MAYEGFNKLKDQLSSESGVKNPSALAASIGRKKYGKKKFQAAAGAGKSLKGAKPAFTSRAAAESGGTTAKKQFKL